MPTKISAINTQAKTKLIYEFQWNTKYCRPFLTGKAREILEISIRASCRHLNVVIISMDISPSNVKLTLRCPPNTTPLNIVSNIKNTSANRLRKIPDILVNPIWSRAYMVCTQLAEFSRPTIAKFYQDEADAETIAQDIKRERKIKKYEERVAAVDAMMDRVFAECAEREKAEAEAAKNRPPSPYGTYDPNRPGGWG